MISKLGEYFTESFKRNMPNAFVFALVLTVIVAAAALLWTEASLIETADAWYKGFWQLLEFGMQVVLMLITGYSIALSPIVKKYISNLAKHIQSPRNVYILVIVIGLLLAMISWGWMVITAILARELALRIKGLNYYYLIACVYFSGGLWVTGLSSSIPLLLNTENNFLIESAILSETIPTGLTLGSSLNFSIIILYFLIGPLIFWLLAPKKVVNLTDILSDDNKERTSIIEEAEDQKLPFKTLSDSLNNSMILQYIVGCIGIAYIIFYFSDKGFDLNLNIMIFIFIMLGLLLHKTPMRYCIAMKRSSSNISGILFQYPFYAAIMGIMIYTGLGEKLAELMASVATIKSYPFYAFASGGLVNFAIPSAGGEFAVIGPSILNAVKEIGAGLPDVEVQKMMARASLSVAYGESLTNLLQPFYLLIILPIMGTGIKVQPRDLMGYFMIPFVIFFILIALLVLYIPL